MIFRSYLLFHLFELVLSRILLYIVKIVFKAEKKRVLFVNEDDTLTSRTSEGKHTDKTFYGCPAFSFITTSEKIKYHFKVMSYSSIDVYGVLPLEM